MLRILSCPEAVRAVWRRRNSLSTSCLLLLLVLATPTQAQDAAPGNDLAKLIAAIDDARATTAGSENANAQGSSAPKAAKLAAELVNKLQADPKTSLSDVLSAMNGASDIAQNWLLSIAQTVANRNVEASKEELAKFLERDSTAPNARYWAFEFLTRDDEPLRKSLLRTMLDDPSLELRYEAVELGLKEIEEANLQDEAKKIASYRKLFESARLASQVQKIAKKLADLGEEIDLQSHFGFISDWEVLGTFDNVDGVGFEAAYGPEADFVSNKLTSSQVYDGKSGNTAWSKLSTDADDGTVDLATALNKEKGAVAYALGSFNSPAATRCQIRLGSPNASKVWLNGNLVLAREVYHSGNQIDQYVAPVELQQGLNSILVKSCQNEQDQPWAQDWAFQLRFTDASGAAIPSAD